MDIHEWLPDLTFNFTSDEEVKIASNECTAYKGDYNEDIRNWEKLSSVSDRAFTCLKKYLNYDRIIVVTHGIVMRQFKYYDTIPYCGITEIEFDEDFKWCGWIENQNKR